MNLHENEKVKSEISNPAISTFLYSIYTRCSIGSVVVPKLDQSSHFAEIMVVYSITILKIDLKLTTLSSMYDLKVS